MIISFRHCIHFAGLILAALALHNVAHSQAPSSASRVWKDKSGRFRVEATLESVSTTVVRLRRADNDKVVEVPLTSLSEGDLDFLRKLSPDLFEVPKERIQTASALEAAAKKRRYAMGALVMYRSFLDDPEVSDEEKRKAALAMERWKPLAASAKVRAGNSWYTPAEFADLESDESKLLAKAEQQLLAGDPVGVKKTLDEAVKLNPSSIRASFRLGILSALHPRGRNAEDAQQQFTECVRRLQSYSSDWTDVDKANLAACYNNLALTCIRQRQSIEAIQNWEKCLEFGTPPHEALHNFGYFRAVARPDALARSGAFNFVYLSPGERNRFDKMTSRIVTTAQSYEPSRGWRYMRLAKASAGASDPPTMAPGAAPPSAIPSHLVKVGTGTGFIIGKNHIATNRHVADAGVAFKVRHESEEEAVARVALLELKSSDLKIDLALLKTSDLLPPPMAFFDSSPKLSEEIRVLGFPLDTRLGANIKVSRGIIASLPPHRGIEDPTLERSIFHDAATDGGSSGGPVCNQFGHIVGVHYRFISGHNNSQYKACVASNDAISFFRPKVPDLVTAISDMAPPVPWEVAVEHVRQSTVQVIVFAEQDSLEPIDKDLGKALWDAYDDPWCMACYGRRTLECQVRGCSRGTIGSFKDTFIPNPTGAGGRTQRTPIRLRCDHCDGRGRVRCENCEFGFDPRFVTSTTRAWVLRYVALLTNVESSK